MNQNLILKPLGSKVLVELQTKTHEGRFEIPANLQKPARVGRIVSLGSSNPEELMIGDKVMLSIYGDKDIFYDNKHYRLVDQAAILMKMLD